MQNFMGWKWYRVVTFHECLDSFNCLLTLYHTKHDLLVNAVIAVMVMLELLHKQLLCSQVRLLLLHRLMKHIQHRRLLHHSMLLLQEVRFESCFQVFPLTVLLTVIQIDTHHTHTLEMFKAGYSAKKQFEDAVHSLFCQKWRFSVDCYLLAAVGDVIWTVVWHNCCESTLQGWQVSTNSGLSHPAEFY